MPLALTYPSGTARLFVASYEICARLFLWSKELVRSHSLIARYVFIALLSVYGWNYVGKKLKISEFIASNKVHKTYANFYESYYKAPDIESIKQSFSTIQKPRNLLVIYMESMEATFGSKDARDFAVKISLPFAELTQNLNSLASSGISFSHIRQTTGTGWTIAGLISYNCAFPQTWLPFNAGFMIVSRATFCIQQLAWAMCLARLAMSRRFSAGRMQISLGLGGFLPRIAFL